MSRRLAPFLVVSLVVVAPLAASPAAQSSATARCRSAVPWQNARKVAGTVAEVIGPVVGTSSGRTTFLHIGRTPPDRNRFTVVIRGRNRGKFRSPERRYRGRTICVIGHVMLDRGVPQTEVRTPAQIRVVR